MSVLSLTYHCPENLLEEWEEFLENEFSLSIENLIDTKQYILSEVYSEMLNEGKNYNLLLVFKNDEERLQFIENKIIIIQELIGKHFGQEVMDFITLLNPRKLQL